MPGEKGWRSPLPKWWVDEANDRLKRRGLDKKKLAYALQSRGRDVSEMMVLRALHPEDRSAGRELLKVDPKRFADLLELAERIVRIHQDPMSIPLAPAAAAESKRRDRPKR